MKPIALLRRFRFSLAGMLVVVTALCLLLGLQVRKTRRQQQAVAAIEALGGDVQYDFQLDENGDERYELDANGNPIGLARPPRLHRQFQSWGLSSFYSAPVVAVRLRQPLVTDDELRPLADLPRLRVVSIYGPQITDEGLKHLASAHELEDLDLIMTKETDATLRMAATFPSLRRAFFSSRSVTDEGVRSLGRLKKLKRLHLMGREITDRALAHIESIPALEMLTLQDTQVTDEGVAKLKAALPKCEVLGSGSSLIP